MTENTSAALAAWLGKLDNVSDIRAVTVTIRRTGYEACFYKDNTHGDGLRLYVIGELPACYKRRRKTCFRFPGSDVDWYVAAHMSGDNYAALKPEQKTYHPVAAHFLLCRWEVPDGTAIDYYEVKKPYDRVEMMEDAANE